MALGIQTESGNGGDFLPIIKYDAKAGRLFVVERTQGAQGWETQNHDITMSQPSFMIDFANIEVGWISFGNGAPSFVMTKVGQPLAPRPSNDHKQGFRVRCYATTAWKGTREFAHTAKAVLGVIDALHTEVMAAPETAQGKLPVVRLTNVKEVATQTPHGVNRNYAPVLEIVGWADRPADFGDKPAATNGNGHATAPAPQATPPAPPPPMAAPAPATAGNGNAPLF